MRIVGVNRNKSLRELYNAILLIDILVCLYIEILKCYIGVARIINFIPDILNLIVIIYLVKEFLTGRITIYRRASSVFLFLFFFVVTLSFANRGGALIDCYQRYRYILFGIIAYYLTTHYMDESYWNRILKVLYVSQIIHTILIVYQFAVLKTRPDITNGIFGFAELNNAAQGSFCLVMSLIGMEYFLKKKWSSKYCISMILMSCITCAIAEIKAFYVIFIISGIFIFIFTSKNKQAVKRCLIILTIGIIGIVAAYMILLKILPENLYAFASISAWETYEGWETGRAGGYGRATQLSYTFSQVFNGDVLSAIIGKGIGYKDANELVGYELSKTFMNFGMIGLGLFLLFIFSLFIECYKGRKESEEVLISLSMCIVTLLALIMWNVTFTRMALLSFVILALGRADFARKNNELINGREAND